MNECLARGCHRVLNDFGVMCWYHWRKVPEAAREAIANPTQVMGQVAAIVAAIEIVAQVELAEHTSTLERQAL